MIGPRLGSRIGPRIGPAIGAGTDEIGSGVPVGGVLDATSGKGVPLTQAEWNAVFDRAGVARKTVHSTWGFQDASGNAAPSVGAALTAAGTIAYGQSVTGWSRRAQRFSQAAATRQAWATGEGPSPATTSSLWIGYFDMTAIPAATRSFLGIINGSATWTLRIDTASHFLLNATAGAADVIAGGVRPFAILVDNANSRIVGYTDAETISIAYALPTDNRKGFGSSGTPPPMDVLWGAHFAGANAEWTDAEMSAVLTAMNWSVAW